MKWWAYKSPIFQISGWTQTIGSRTSFDLVFGGPYVFRRIRGTAGCEFIMSPWGTFKMVPGKLIFSENELSTDREALPSFMGWVKEKKRFEKLSEGINPGNIMDTLKTAIVETGTGYSLFIPEIGAIGNGPSPAMLEGEMITRGIKPKITEEGILYQGSVEAFSGTIRFSGRNTMTVEDGKVTWGTGPVAKSRARLFFGHGCETIKLFKESSKVNRGMVEIRDATVDDIGRKLEDALRTGEIYFGRNFSLAFIYRKPSGCAEVIRALNAYILPVRVSLWVVSGMQVGAIGNAIGEHYNEPGEDVLLSSSNTSLVGSIMTRKQNWPVRIYPFKRHYMIEDLEKEERISMDPIYCPFKAHKL